MQQLTIELTRRDTKRKIAAMAFTANTWEGVIDELSAYVAIEINPYWKIGSLQVTWNASCAELDGAAHAIVSMGRWQ